MSDMKPFFLHRLGEGRGGGCLLDDAPAGELGTLPGPPQRSNWEEEKN